MNTKSYAIISIQVLAILATVSLVAPHYLTPPVQVVSAGGISGPAGDSVMRLNCVTLLNTLLATPNGFGSVCPDKIPVFETIVYDTSGDGIWQSGEPIIVQGAHAPVAGDLLRNDAKIKFRDNDNNGVWGAATPEPIFYDIDGTAAHRVFLIGAPTGLGTLIKTDPKIRFIDSDANAAFTAGVIKVTARLENMGGVLGDGSQEDVDAFQIVYDYASPVLKAMRISYPSGNLLPDQGFNPLLGPDCSNSGSGAGALAAASDNGAGQVSSSWACFQGPPRDGDVGLGCDPSYIDPVYPASVCVGDGTPALPGAPISNIDALSIQFLVLQNTPFSLTLEGPPSGSFANDLDGSASVPVPLQLINGGNGPVACFTFGPSPKIHSGDTATFDASCSTDPDTTPAGPGKGALTYTWDFGDGIAGNGQITQHMYTCGGPAQCSYPITLKVTDTNNNIGTTQQRIIVNPPPQKTSPTATISSPLENAKFNVKQQVTYDGSTSRDNNSPPQSITFSWTVDGAPRTENTATLTITYTTPGTHTVVLKVCNSSGLCNSATRNVMVNAIKIQPTVGAVSGPTKANVKQSVTFTVSATDNSNPVQQLHYSWTVDGNPVTGNDAPSLTLPAGFSSPGQHSVTVKVTNTSGLSSDGGTTIMINAIKVNPTAVIAPQPKIFVKTKVTWDGSGSHDNSNPLQSLTYTWTDSAGTVLGNNPTLNQMYNTPGTFTVKLTVCNTSGGCNSTTGSVTVNPIKRNPTAVIAPQPANGVPVKSKVIWDGSGSHDNSNPLQSLTYTWTDSAGTVLGNNPTLNQMYNTPGTFTVKLTVCNTSGGCNSTTGSVTVNPIKATPTPGTVTGPTGGKANVKASVTFTDNGSHDNSNPLQGLSYTWSVDGGPGVPTAGPSFKTSFSTVGQHTVSVKVCNTSGLCSDASTTIMINPVKNNPTAVIAPQPAGGVNVKSKVTWDGTGSHDNSNPLQTLTYTWYDSTGAIIGDMPTLSQTYNTPGVFTVKLTVCNTSGGCDSTTGSVTVNAIKAIPTAVIQCQTATGGLGPCPPKLPVKSTVKYDGTGSVDHSNPPQQITSYTWYDGVSGAVIGNGPTLTQTYNTPGTFTVKLVVCTDHLCGSATNTIKINAIKVNPTAVIRCQGTPTGDCPAKIETDVKLVVGLDGGASFDTSNPVQNIISYQWTDAAGRVLGNNAKFGLVSTVPGRFVITLTVCNQSGLCGSANIEVNVNAVKNAPTAKLAPVDKVDINTKVTYDASGSVDNSNPLQTLSFSWTVDGVARPETTKTLSVTYTTPGLHTVTVHVCNASGMCNDATDNTLANERHDVGINSVTTNPAPPAGSTQVKVVQGQKVTITVSVDNTGTQNQDVTVTVSVIDASGVTTKICSLPGSAVVGQKVKFVCSWNTTNFASNVKYKTTATVEFTDPTKNPDPTPADNTANGPSVLVNPPKLPLVIKSFTISPSPTFVNQPRTLTVTWNGGTGPFACTFNFGDGTASVTISPCTSPQSTPHTYTSTGTFTATVTVVGHNPTDTQRTTLSVVVNPEPTFAHGKLSWKHHLLSPSIQTFTAKAMNPNFFDVFVRIHMDIDRPDGVQDIFNSPSFKLMAGQLRTDMSFTYTPAGGLGKYTFTGRLDYGLDTNGNGMLDDSEVLGMDGQKSGSFALA